MKQRNRGYILSGLKIDVIISSIIFIILGFMFGVSFVFFLIFKNDIFYHIPNTVSHEYSIIQYSDSFYTKASYYEYPFHGRITASGEKYNMNQMTAAHKSLPFGTWVEITDTITGKFVYVRINDRGPFVVGRDIDLSMAAMDSLGMIQKGVVDVKVRIVK